MIDWIHARLRRWGEWMARSKAGAGRAGGYPAYQLVHIRGTATADALCGSDELEIDMVLSNIERKKRALYELACARYVEDLSADLIARRMGVHVNTIHARVDSLHRAVENGIAERKAMIARANQ